MTNAEIRKRTRGLFKAHYWRVGAAMLAVFLIEDAPNILGYIFSITPPAWTASVWALLISPITTLGLIWYMLGVWEGHAPEANRLMAFISPAGVLFRAFGLIIAQSAIVSGISLLPSIVLQSSSLGTLGLMILLFLAALIIMLWVLLRLSLAPLLFIRDPDHRPLVALGTSWRYTRGAVGRILGMDVVLMWPYFLLLLAIFIFADSTNEVWLHFLMPLFGLLYYGYVQIAATGLSTELIRLAEGGDLHDGEIVV